MNDETIRTRVLSKARSHWKLVLHGSSWLLAVIVTASVGIGHKQADGEELIRKVDDLAMKVQNVNITLQQHGEKLAALEATTTMTQNDVRDLKHLADHAQDVADQFKVPRLTGHHVRHP